MSIVVIDGFKVNAQAPVDSRIVASGLAGRNSITYKYEGLRVWDTSDNIPYVWVSGAWQSENASNVSGSGTINYLSKFTSANVMGSSQIFDNGSFVGVNTTTQTAGIRFEVNGDVKATKFWGDGSNLTNLNADNVATGNMPIARIETGTNTYFLVSGSSAPAWTDPATLNIGSATKLQNTRTIFGQNFDGSANVTGNVVFGTQANKATLTYATNTAVTITVPALTNSSSTLAFLQQTQTFTGVNTFSGLVKISLGSVTAPSISFDGDSNTGIYSPGANSLSVTLNGVESVKFETNAVTFGEQAANYPRIRINSTSSATTPSFTWWGNDQTGIYRPSSNKMGFSTNGSERMTVADAGISMVSSTYTDRWTVSSINSDVWVSNLTGSTNASAVDLPATTYDRILYAFVATTGIFTIDLYLETSTGVFELISRGSAGGFDGVSMIIPSGKQWRALIDQQSGSGGSATFTIYKFGK